MPSSRLPAGYGRGGYPPSVGNLQNGRSSALPRSGSSSVFSSLESQRTTSQEQPKCRMYGPVSSTLRSSSMLPAPPGFGLPRANERRIQDDLHFGTEKSNTSLHSSEDFGEEGEDADGRHADGNPPRESKKRDIKPMQPIASMANSSKLGKLDSSTSGVDLRGNSNEQFFANPAVGGFPVGQSPPLSAILRALFPNWVPLGMTSSPQGPWSGQPIAPPLVWVLQGQGYVPNYGPYPQGQGYR